MKKFLLPVFLMLTLSIPCASKEELPEVKFQRIFLTDTSEAEDYIEPETIPLKGYAQYIEDSEAIYLTDDNNQLILNLKVPQKISSSSLAEEHKKIFTQNPMLYSKYGSEEYQISPKDAGEKVEQGSIAFGTNMEQEVDWGELEHTATFFTKYNKGRFAFKTAYERTVGSTYNNYYDSLYVAPELKLNKYLSIKQILTADITKNRKKNEFVLSINPLAKRHEDRLNLELGASQTYDDSNSLIREKFKFNAKFKL